ncbi:MAG TPA: hypothetical protein PKE61_10395, partial [Burkholderiaceae bacterium]|nr:hypothetical protein [Burkholderiaceae bacterium]
MTQGGFQKGLHLTELGRHRGTGGEQGPATVFDGAWLDEGGQTRREEKADGFHVRMGVRQPLLQPQQGFTLFQRLPQGRGVRDSHCHTRFHARSVATMDILITHGNLARTRSLHVRPLQLWLVGAAILVLMLLLSGTVYHLVFMKAAREGWPVVSDLIRLVARDEVEHRDRCMRENLDAMAQKVGEMQAKMIKLEAVGARVSGLAGIKAEEMRALDAAGNPVGTEAAVQPASTPAKAAPAGGGRG